MITYYKNVFLLLTTVAVNVGCQYLLEEYAPSYGNYEPTKYSIPIEFDVSGDSFHKVHRRNSDDKIFDLSKAEENIQLEQIIADDAGKTSLYNRVRRGGVYGEKTEKLERKILEGDNTDTKNQRNRYTSRFSPDVKINTSNEKTASKLTVVPPTNSSRRNLSSRRRNDQPTSSNQKRIVKKENFAESHFLQSAQPKDIEYISNYNLNPVNIENIPFQNDDQKFLHQLSSIQPQHFIHTNQQLYQSFPSSTPQPIQQPQDNNNQEKDKLIINVPDESTDYTQGKQKQIEQGLTYIHSQPHVQSHLQNIQKYVTPNEAPRVELQNYQPPVYNQPQDQKPVEIYTNPNQPQIQQNFQRVEYNTPEPQKNYQTQNVPVHQPEYGTKINANEDPGIIAQDNGEVKYINYGYRQQNQQPQPNYVSNHQNPVGVSYNYNTNNNYPQFNRYTQPNYGSNLQNPSKVSYNYNTNNNYPQITEEQIKPNDKLNSQSHYPAILVHIDGKTGIPFYPTSKNIFNIPQDAQFDYEGIPLVNLNKKEEHSYETDQSNRNEDFRKEVYKSHYGYGDDEEEEPNAQRRLYTGLTFHASSRNLYDGKTPSLQNPPPRLGDVIWQAGDPITDPQEILVRQLNETCAYIQFNETTPGNEDGSKLNIWQAGDYSAQREEEELIRSVNITCENYTTDALSNFTSGYTIIDYCSQCVNKYSEGDYEYDYSNQNQANVYANSGDQDYNSYYQPSQEQYQYYNDGFNSDPALENGEIAGFYKRKRLAQDNSNKKQ